MTLEQLIEDAKPHRDEVTAYNKTCYPSVPPELNEEMMKTFDMTVKLGHAIAKCAEKLYDFMEAREQKGNN